MKKYLVADLFCGAGGSSTGAERAIKSLGAKMVLVCVNHWPLAIETHRKNHPTARHYIEDVTVARPQELVPEGYLDLLMASPECTHFSRARGGKPVSDQSRMNPWAVIRWLTTLDVKCLLVENVPEFIDWGPVDMEGRPVPEMKGVYFDVWIKTIKGLGYRLAWRFLNAADYGDATTRRRFFLIARRSGRVRWPAPTHSPTGYGGLKKWRPARDIIDWENAGRSLLDDPKYKKRPLSINTRRRIARGLEKYGGVYAPLYIRLLGLPDNGDGHGSPEAFTIQNRAHATPRDLGRPIHTVTAAYNGGQILVIPTAEPFIMANRSNSVPRGMGQPIHTITAENMGNLYKVEPVVEPFILGQHSCSAPRSTGKPIPTVAGAGAISIVDPQIIKYYGTKKDTNTVDKPLDTVTTKDRFALVNPLLVQTDQTGGNGSYVRDIDSPVSCIVTKNNMALAEPVIVPTGHGERSGQAPRAHGIDNPVPTMTTRRNLGLVEPVLEKALSTDINPRRLVLIDGAPYILDIRFRMLTNRELARAMGFDDAETNYEFLGTVAEVTKQIGNAVPVNLAAELVKAILGRREDK